MGGLNSGFSTLIPQSEQRKSRKVQTLVWVVYPSLRLIQVFESMTRIRVVTAADELDGGGVLPGFRVAVAALFPEAATDEGTPSS